RWPVPPVNWRAIFKRAAGTSESSSFPNTTRSQNPTLPRRARQDGVNFSGVNGWLIFGVEAAEGELACQELAFVAIQRGQLNVRYHHLAQPGVLYSEVVHATLFRGEVSGRGFVARSDSNERLPTGAEMMLSGIDSEREIGVAVVGPDPRAVESY